MPIVFAQTIVDAPKYGARSRAAAISAPRLAAPTTKTTISSGGRRICPTVWSDRFPTGPGASLPSVTTAELAALDRRLLWHPFTQQQGWEEEEPLIVDRAQGTTLYDTEGNRYIDGVSSLWTNVHGEETPSM